MLLLMFQFSCFIAIVKCITTYLSRINKVKTNQLNKINIWLINYLESCVDVGLAEMGIGALCEYHMIMWLMSVVLSP